MVLLMLESKEYSKQVVKHHNCSQKSVNLIMQFQKISIISPTPHTEGIGNFLEGHQKC